jgi:cyclomaltodextrin glucanotransferase
VTYRSFIFALVLAGCGAPAPSRCPLTVWYRPAALDTAHADLPPALIGSWDGWSSPGLRSFATVTADDGTTWRTATINLAPGVYQYAVAVGDLTVKDELNPRSAFIAGAHDRFEREVSEVALADCSAPTFTATAARADGNALVVEADFAAGTDGAGLARSSLAATLTQAGAPVAAAVAVDSDGKHVTARADALPAGKYALTLTARDTHGRALTTAASAFVATPLQPASLADTLVYQVMIDRFRGAGPLAAPASPGDRAGGTLDGVRAALDAGYFDRLGVTTLWLSPVYTNPDDHLVGRDGHLVAPYHGYWPEDPRGVDAKLGGEAQLDALVADAHARGLRVILDVVPNHVFQTHPWYLAHSRLATPPGNSDSWFNDGPDACVCGDPGCDWGSHMETCWFASYLPDLNWRHPDVMRAGSDDLVWWMTRFDLDGLRIDAVPMMPRAASRRMVHAVREMMYRPAADLYVVGETYTGPGDGGRAEIRAYLGDSLDGLGGAFDFPLMWAARDAIAHDAPGGFATLEHEIAAGAMAWSGSGATIAHMIGNHDTTRFLSEAAGDAGGDAWSAPPPQPNADEPYRRQRVALALVMTLPGVPVLYYGDEVGLAGGSDPDSRRVMPDVLGGALPTEQQALLDAVAAIGRARRCSPALRGTRTSIVADADHDVALHASAAGDHAVVVLSRASDAATVDAPGIPAGNYRDVLSGATFSSDGAQATFTVAALAAAIYLPEGSACLP